MQRGRGEAKASRLGESMNWKRERRALSKCW
jgi:hypothetical protein